MLGLFADKDVSFRAADRFEAFGRMLMLDRFKLAADEFSVLVIAGFRMLMRRDLIFIAYENFFFLITVGIMGMRRA